MSTSAPPAPVAPVGPASLPVKDAPVLEARGISRAFGNLQALKDVTFDVPAGAICGLIGPNGAGKTTLLRILAGLDEPDEGTRLIDGIDVALRPHDARSRFGYVPDFAALYDGLSVLELLTFFARVQGVPADDVDGAVRTALHNTGLDPVSERPAAALSKGMTQRVCVALALVHGPAVLFLDEPASGLDPRARIELKELLKALRASGKTILISSHILSELGDLVDRVLILEKGAVKAVGPLEVAWQSASSESGVRVRVELTGEVERAETVLRKHALVAEVRRDGLVLDVQLQFPVPSTEPGPAVAELVRLLVQDGVPVCAVIPVRANLESLFMTVTKGDLQ